jgi:hypothetical protein
MPVHGKALSAHPLGYRHILWESGVRMTFGQPRHDQAAAPVPTTRRDAEEDAMIEAQMENEPW